MDAVVRDAIVMVGPDDGRREVARVPLLERTLRTLERTGFERCTLVGAEIPVVRTSLRLATVPALVAGADESLCLLVGPGVVLDAALVRDLIERARPGEVVEIATDGVHVRVGPGARVADRATRALPPARGVLAAATAPRGVAERALLRGLENHRDGYLDRLLHRRLSRPLTRILLRTPISPNMVTVLGIAIGVAGGLLLGASSGTGVTLGVLCLVASGVLDCSDGELARLRFAESRLGHVLDVTGDTVVHGAVLAGIVSYLVRSGTTPSRSVLVVLAAGVLGAFAAITWSDATEARRHRVDAWENRVLDGALSPLSTRDWHVFVVLFALAGRLDRLVVGAAIGAHAFWILVVILVARALARAGAVGG